ncbi:cyclic lactone autoinducer peptide AgrD [Staphylococcus pseudoxylosus]|nr:cyclic lactone autoinducer peptide [Staphylococcus pseudoxylosus]MBM2659445.1 cyclic lactone autoinducer peptide [Staphylococcus pseudoxylosus]MEB5784322.1 cyclic lactone autoinducer peptide [Staphylococcus pseudoxylosus]MEB6333676.1 cyclic lactone autoinducer peptide [Staphylococcus pseudoxylosus]PTI82288.1 cyclic lactone autoinducer peptide [Staphylococcus xylosus]
MNIFTAILTIFAKFFTLIGAISSVNPCAGYVDEPEIPKELTNLYE